MEHQIPKHRLSPAKTYYSELADRFWNYRDSQFAGQSNVFEQESRKDNRPPVFLAGSVERNVLVDPSLDGSSANAMLAELPRAERHRWFGSMKSSQALALSVFGNLKAMKLAASLSGIVTEEGGTPFAEVTPNGSTMEFERRVTNLAEIRPTSVDVFVNGNVPVAVECKFSETGVGTCSRPRRKKSDVDYCDGCFRFQMGRSHRCALSSAGMKYWDYIPELFNWGTEIDGIPCPFRETYQLVRNVLAASVGDGGEIRPGIAVLIYDRRNPEFAIGGSGELAFSTAKAALKDPLRLQRISWQALMAGLRIVPAFRSMDVMIGEKYGI